MADTTDTATVALAATDEISSPTLQAINSLQQLQATIGQLATASKGLTGSSVPAAAGVRAVGEASGASAIPHRAAHQALNLVSTSMAGLAGASPAAEAGVRVLDAVMFQVAIHGAAISMGFVGLVVAAAGVGAAMKSAAEETKKEADSLEAVKAGAVKAVSGLTYLSSYQRGVAGVAAGDLSAKIIKLKSDIGDLSDKMKENVSSSSGVGIMSKVGLWAKETFSMGSTTGTSGINDAAAAAQVKMAGNLRVLQEELKKTQHEYDLMTQKSGAYKSVLQNIGNPLQEFENQMTHEASTLEAVGRALGDVGSDAEDMGAIFREVESISDRMGVTYERAAGIMKSQTDAVKSGVIGLASTIGTAMGNAISGTRDAWKEGLKAIIGAVFDMATQVVIAAAIMNQAITAAFIPGTFAGILAMVVVLQALKQVAIGALSSGISSNSAAASANVAGGDLGVGSPGGAPSGPGGTAVASAQSQVTNNIQVNLPVQALDLASISDIQLKSFANRVGRVIAEAAGQGQFSLVGA